MSATRFRVELRQPRRVRHLGMITTTKPHFRTLDPFYSRLVRDGLTGWLLLIDDRTGAIVARRHISTAAA
jgi:hypothetical protein